MRRLAFGLLGLGGACGGGEGHPRLHFDVSVHKSATYQSVIVFAVDPARPDAIDPLPFAHPGECDETSDAVFCTEECPGPWITGLRIVRAGETLGESYFSSPSGSGIGFQDVDLDGAVLIISDDDGQEVEVPLPSPRLPVPTIEDVTRTNVGLNRDEFAIAWSATPPAVSAVVSLSGGYGGPRCHDVGTEGVTTMEHSTGGAILGAYVTAYAAPTAMTTAFGDVEVWVGGATSLDLLAE